MLITLWKIKANFPPLKDIKGQYGMCMAGPSLLKDPGQFWEQKKMCNILTSDESLKH